jgi:hypothetical protein
MASTSMRNGNGAHNGGGLKNNVNGTIPEHPSINTNGLGPMGREPSPTLPSLPSHATLSSMILSSSPYADEAIINDPAVLSSEQSNNSGPPRIGDPGKRMLGAALGVRHPGLGPRNVNGNDQGLTKVMGGLTVAE